MHKEKKLINLLSQANVEGNELGPLVNLLKGDLDWNYILKYSEEEGVSAFLYYHLNKHSEKKYIPGDIFEKLKTIYYNNSLRNTLISEEAKKILAVFKKENTQAIILKGIFLAEHIYQNIALRQITDIDLLTRKEDLAKVNRILNTLGYCQPLCFGDFLDKEEITPLNSLVYHHPRHQFFIHLHWHLVNSTWPLDYWVRKIDMERIWQQMQRIITDEEKVSALAAHHLLIYLSLHGFNHSFDRLVLLSDLREVLKYFEGKIDWDLMMKEARNFHLSEILFFALFFVSQKLKVEIPRLDELRPKQGGFLEKLSYFLSQRSTPNYKLSYLTFFLRQKGFHGKLRFILRTIFPSRLVMAQNLMRSQTEITLTHYLIRIKDNLYRFLPSTN